jgi:hypothetical protein
MKSSGKAECRHICDILAKIYETGWAASLFSAEWGPALSQRRIDVEIGDETPDPCPTYRRVSGWSAPTGQMRQEPRMASRSGVPERGVTGRLRPRRAGRRYRLECE